MSAYDLFRKYDALADRHLGVGLGLTLKIPLIAWKQINTLFLAQMVPANPPTPIHFRSHFSTFDRKLMS